MIRDLFVLSAVLAGGRGAMAQALPRIAALYPAGARAGSTVEVAIRGGGLDGARQVIVDGKGVSAVLNAADLKVDPAEQKVFQAKCAQCHELRGPGTISRTPDQWLVTLDRMIREKGAPIEAADRTRIANYLQAAARAAAGLTAKVAVAPDATPGRREIRVVAANGTSTAFPFEITSQPESLESEPNNEPAKAPAVTLPITVNGQLDRQSDVDDYAFEARQGERLVFNCSAIRLNESAQAYFYPILSLLDANGKELIRNNGYFGLDPLIDWTAPAAGRYVLQVRDLLYRGSPATVYRLSMGALPYKTYLLPPGGRRGETASVTVSGENMAPAAVPVPLERSATVGVRQVNTAQGAFPFVVGDFPEWTEEDSASPNRSVQLPVSLNARIAAPGETDRYTFTVDQAALGAYTFEAFAARVGSPLVTRLTLYNASGQPIATSASDRGARDPRLDYTFTRAGEYTLAVTDAAGKGSPAHVYRISAGRAAPDFLLTISPDNPNLGPGASVYLQVRVQRRVGIPGDIEVALPQLPAGVTASPCVIRSDQNQGFVILTAAANAAPGTFSLARAVGRAQGESGTIEREAIPFEVYRINNNPQILTRANMVVTVGPPADWTVTLEPERSTLAPDAGPIKVTARLVRRGNERDLPFAILGVPAGVQAPGSILFKRGQNELTFTLTPTNGGVFSQAGAGAVKQFLVAVVNGREGEAMMMASPAVPISIGASVQKP